MDSAGIGMATGGGMYFAAGASTVLALIILWGMHPVQKRFSAKFKQRTLTVIAKAHTNPKAIIERLVEDKSVDYTNFIVTKGNKEITIELKLTRSNHPMLAQIVEALNEDPTVKKVYWNK